MNIIENNKESIQYSIVNLTSSEGIFTDGDWVESKDQDPSGQVRLIQLADIKDGYFEFNSNKFLTLEKAIELNCTFLKKGDILISRMPDPIGRACIFPGNEKKCITAVDVCILRPDNPLIDPNWLKYAINSPECRKEIIRRSRGTTRKRIPRKELGKIQLSIPNLETQRKIVAILEKAEATQRLRADADALTQELVQSVFLEMFGDPVTNPKGWEKVTLGSIIQKVEAGPSRRLNAEGKGPVNITSGEIHDGMSIKATKLKYIDVPEDITRYVLKKDDILLNYVNSLSRIGKSAVYQGEYSPAIVGHNIFRINVNRKLVNPFFLVAQFKTTFFMNQIKRITKPAVNQASFNTKDLRKCVVVLPPVLFQEKFIQSLKHIDSAFTDQSKANQEIADLFALLQSKAFTGELIP
ncbi:restriction endonuclease subunit S [Methanogenium sp. S4BF]|uniref:restriction endonuclease subunit S n=1 Tax=Methanogenium sp. S4BF TaxID=1789226 RepID=UPI0024171A2B|nr:restriction endonuclease subunit S [Methanogenium sp. S4BF]WFN35243.1 restriction endonuclease subunit S [Methanogenium sp. S4BF]